MTHEIHQSEKKLSAALRALAAASQQGASPEGGLMLKDAFRRHHLRRKRVQMARVTLLALCIAGLVGWLLRGKPALQNATQQAAVVHIVPPQEVSYPATMSASKIRRPALPRRVPSAGNDRATSTFLALPSFDMVPAGDELRVVRLQLPGEDLRLVGAQVTEEMARRRVTADFVVGHDGTPYAVRLVRSNF